jgi:hypothetical protein
MTGTPSTTAEVSGGTRAGTGSSASERIAAEVGSWPGVESGLGRRGEFGFRLGRREIGHLHGDHAAHFFFAPEDWQGLRAQQRIDEHPVFPGRVGPAARQLRTDADVTDVIALMRLNYDRIEAAAR